MIPARLASALAIAGGVLAIALTASGCTAVNAGSGQPPAQTVMPKVGDCWRVTYADAAQSEDWEGAGPVACTTTHQSYTYAVTKLTTTFTGSWLDSKGNPRSDIDLAAFNACRSRQKAILADITPTEALFYPTYYVPSIAQWNAGARWVRCDMTRIKVGSEVSKPSLISLPARFSDLLSELKATPEKFALCENDIDNNGPDGAGTTYADCTQPADWTFKVRLTLPGTSSAPYPGESLLDKLGAQKCAATVVGEVGHDIVAKTPDKSAWVLNGVRTVDCWLNNN